MPRNKGSPYRVYIDIEFAIALYGTGNYRLKDLAKLFGVSAATMHYKLHSAGCEFIRTRRIDPSPDEWLHRSLAQKGKQISLLQRIGISERNSCNYNGLNGYGHTKDHNHGYVRAYAPLHPHAAKDGYVMLHTVLIEQKLGRYLEEDEVVHHINHDRKDNRIENLQLMKKKDHMSMHMKERHTKRRSDYH